jgi:hypothetical protein
MLYGSQQLANDRMMGDISGCRQAKSGFFTHKKSAMKAEYVP